MTSTTTKLNQRLLHIPIAAATEDDWVTHRDMLKSFLKLFLTFTTSRMLGVVSQFIIANWMSQRGEDYLEASNLITKYVNWITLSGIVAMYATSILQKQEPVSNREEMRPKILMAASWVALILAIPTSVLMTLGTKNSLTAMGQPTKPSALTQDYVNGFVLTGGLLTTWLSVAYQQTAFAKEWRGLVVGINFLRQAINLLLAYGWLFGRLGLDDYGAKGVGWARSISTAVDLLLFMIFFVYKGLLPRNIPKVAIESLRLVPRVANKALATGARTCIELSAEFIGTIFIGLTNVEALAASEIYAQYWQLINVLILTATQSTSLQVAKYKSQATNSQRMTQVALAFTAPMIVGITASTVLASHATGGWMEKLFVQGDDESSQRIRTMAHQLLWFLIANALFGIIKGVSSGALLGRGNFNLPLKVSVHAMLVLGTGLSAALCFPTGWSAYGVYAASTFCAGGSAAYLLKKAGVFKTPITKHETSTEAAANEPSYATTRSITHEP